MIDPKQPCPILSVEKIAEYLECAADRRSERHGVPVRREPRCCHRLIPVADFSYLACCARHTRAVPKMICRECSG